MSEKRDGKRRRLSVDELLWAHSLEGELDPLAAQRVIGVQLLEMAVRNHNLLLDVMDRMDALESNCERRHAHGEEPQCAKPQRGLSVEYRGGHGGGDGC